MGFGWLFLNTALAQSFRLRGQVNEQVSGFSIALVNISISGNVSQTISTNNEGQFIANLPGGSYELIFSHVAYETFISRIELKSDTLLHWDLQRKTAIDEVQIDGVGGKLPQSLVLGKVQLQSATIKNLPALFGESDVLKSIQLLPGVLSGGDGSNQFYVRGGMSDQNLILLDGAPVLNASHLFGFFSTFNADAIQQVDLYKGGMPAKYGGRISSVLDIQQTAGNTAIFKVEGGVGLIASRLKIESPIVVGKSSFMLSGRRTYADLFLKFSNNPDVNQSQLYFYDINFKTAWSLNAKHHISLSAYSGTDQLRYSDVFDFGWGNDVGSINWHYSPSTFWTIQTSASYSKYNYEMEMDNVTSGYQLAAALRQLQIRHDWNWNPITLHQLQFGVSVGQAFHRPASYQESDPTRFHPIVVPDQKFIEWAAYASHDWRPLKDFTVQYGLRATQNTSSIILLEPRISMQYQLRSNQLISGSFNKNAQFIHQLSSNTTQLPTDIWLLSNNTLKPQVANQWALGYFLTTKNNHYQISLETYYKRFLHQMEYKDGANMQLFHAIEQELLFGKGRAYGLEWQFKKNVGKLQGWIAYTLSRSERQFDSINQGAWYQARQDRPHDVSLVATLDLNQHWQLSGNFVYATGQAVSLPTSKYHIQGETFYYFAKRNDQRMPDYHRMDVSVAYSHQMRTTGTSTWNIGFFNVYNRKNTYMLDFRQNEQQPLKTDIYRIALFGIIPSVTWNFNF